MTDQTEPADADMDADADLDADADAATEPDADALVLDRPIDQVTPSFFRDIVDEYVAEDRLDRGVARLGIDGDRERRFVIADELPDLDDEAYLTAELAELLDVLDADDDILDAPLEISIPVADRDRVIEEVESDGAVTVLFQPQGIETILEQLLVHLQGEESETA